jgi:branched-chain amino acid transport system substrate-binding protein
MHECVVIKTNHKEADMKKRVILILMAAFVVVMLISGWSWAQKPSSLDIGIATPLTGPAAFLGNQVSNAVLLAIDNQNAQGGVTIGGQKYTLNPIQRDTKADAAVGKTVAEELVLGKKVKIIAGPFQADAIGVQSVTEPNKVLTFFIQFLTPEMTGPSKPYSFAVSFPIPQMIYKCLYYIQKKYPQAKTVFSMEADVPDAPAFAGTTEGCCKLLGFNYLGFEKVPMDTRDFAPIIARVRTHNPDVIDIGNIGGVMGGLGALLIKQIRDAGFSGIIFTPAAPPEEVMEQTVPAQSLDKVINANYVDVNGPVADPKYRDVMNRFLAKYKQPPVDIVPAYYNVMTGLFQFLNTQDTMDTRAWMQGFANYRWKGVMGFESSWIGLVGDGINRRVFQNNWVTHYENGKPVTDYTAPIAESLFVIK